MTMEPFRLIDGDEGPATALEPGPMLLEASAGTGKTYTIAGLVARLVVQEDLRLDRIAVMTFTIAATAELRDRIRATLAEVGAALSGPGPETPDRSMAGWLRHRWDSLPQAEQAAWLRRIRRALACVDAAPIATIHSFARRLAMDHAAAVGVDPAAEVTVDLDAWRDEQVQDWFRIHLGDADLALASHLGGDVIGMLTAAARSVEQHPLASLATPARDAGQIADDLRTLPDRWQQTRARIVAAFPQLAELRKNSIFHPNKLPDRLEIVDAIVAGAPVAGKDRTKVADLWDAAKLEAVVAATGVDPSLFANIRDLLPEPDGDRAALAAAFIPWYMDRLRDRHRHARQLHVSDALLGLDRALAGRDGASLATAIGSRFDAVLVDEFQDTDLVQWRILERAFAGTKHRLVLIGDPKQAIYAFRGADVYAYAAASGRVAADRRFTLNTNWRSDQALIAALNALYLGHGGTGAVPDAFAMPGVGYHPVQAARPCRFTPGQLDPAPVQIIALPGEMTASSALTMTVERVCDEVRRLLDPSVGARIHATEAGQDPGRPVAPGDIAILVRSHHQAERLHRALGRLGIPALRQDKRSVFAGDAARELEAVLGACLDPVREHRVRAAAGTQIIGLGAAALASDPPSAAVRDLPVRLADLGDLLRHRGIAAWWYRFIDLDLGGGCPRLRMARLADGGRMAMDMLHLIELLAEEEALPPDAIPGWLGQARLAAEQGEADEARQRRLERDDAAVRILTVHVSKGLQFPIVIEAFAWTGCKQVRPPLLIHPGDGPDAVRLLAPPDQAAVRQAERESLGDDLRKLYVSLTRAEHRLLVIWAKAKPWKSSLGSTASGLAWLLGARGGGHGLGTDAYGAVAQAWGMIPVLPTLPGLRWTESAPEEATPVMPVSAPPSLPDRAAPTDGRILRSWARCSFTGLSRLAEADDAVVVGEADGVDHDQSVAAITPDPDEAPGSAALGTLVHSIFETGDFARWRSDPATLVEEVRRAGERDHLPLTVPQAERLAAGMRRAVLQPVQALGTAIADLPAHGVAREWPVRLRIARGCDDLGALFAGQTPLTPAWPARLGRVRLPTGVFTGVLDALVVVDGRHHVVDWKTNRLPAYDRPHLQEAMADSHYILQAHLYLLAVHRFLRVRLPEYDPGLHLGVAAYAFVRGTVDGEPDTGWAVVPANPTILERLDACCD